MSEQELLRNLSESIQNDLITFLDGMDDEIINGVCDIVVKNIREAETP